MGDSSMAFEMGSRIGVVWIGGGWIGGRDGLRQEVVDVLTG